VTKLRVADGGEHVVREDVMSSRRTVRWSKLRLYSYYRCWEIWDQN